MTTNSKPPPIAVATDRPKSPIVTGAINEPTTVPITVIAPRMPKALPTRSFGTTRCRVVVDTTSAMIDRRTLQRQQQERRSRRMDERQRRERDTGDERRRGEDTRRMRTARQPSRKPDDHDAADPGCREQPPGGVVAKAQRLLGDGPEQHHFLTEA